MGGGERKLMWETEARHESAEGGRRRQEGRRARRLAREARAAAPKAPQLETHPAAPVQRAGHLLSERPHQHLNEQKHSAAQTVGDNGRCTGLHETTNAIREATQAAITEE